MTGPTLASRDDVRAVLKRDLTSEEEAAVEPILIKASELFRQYSGQHFTLGVSEVRLRVSGGKVYLPQRPATEVHSVVDDDGHTVEFTQFKQWLTVCHGSHEFVVVHYSHGSAVVPDLVRVTVAEVAKKVLTIDPRATTGVTQHQEMVGPYSSLDSYATWAQGGQTMLSPDDRAIAESFKFTPPKMTVMRP